MKAVLVVTNLTKIFRSGYWPFSKHTTHSAVNTISFELKKGEILGLLGPNGAGKTTTIQMLLGTLTPTSGTITYFGKNFAHHRHEILKKLGYASGYDKLPAQLTISENLDIIARIYGIPAQKRAARIDHLLTFFNIAHMKDRHTGTLSAGQMTRVMLTKAFLASPSVILLDEPTASLDPDIAHDIRQFILAEQKESHTSFIITSHNMDEVTQLCDRILVLKNGAIIANNRPDVLVQSLGYVRVHLIITQGHGNIIPVLSTRADLRFTQEDNNLTLWCDEHAIAPTLIELSKQMVTYSHISIDKPTLNDYFISIAKQKGTV